jgi:hypothetical protein
MKCLNDHTNLANERVRDCGARIVAPESTTPMPVTRVRYWDFSNGAWSSWFPRPSVAAVDTTPLSRAVSTITYQPGAFAVSPRTAYPANTRRPARLAQSWSSTIRGAWRP